MSINKEIKKKVKNEWLIAFNELTSYSSNQLFRLTGPILFGLDISPLPPGHLGYRPILECYGLWKEDLPTCLKSPYIFAEFYDKREFQLDIKYKAHENDNMSPIQDAVMLIREQCKIPFEGDVKLTQLFDELDRFTSNRTYNNLIFVHIGSIEMKIRSALYIGAKDTATSILNDAAEISKLWDPSRSQAYIGNREDWLEGFKQDIENPEKLIRNVNINLANPKLKNLHRSALIAD